MKGAGTVLDNHAKTGLGTGESLEFAPALKLQFNRRIARGQARGGLLQGLAQLVRGEFARHG